VTVSPSNELIGSTDVAVSATTFVLTGCRAWDTVSGDLRPRCVSLMDANHTDWYVHDSSSYLRLDPESSAPDVPLFQQESSFILHTDLFYPGYYALESLHFPDYYMRLRDDGDLWIEHDANTATYKDAASFTFYLLDSSRKHTFVYSFIFDCKKDHHAHQMASLFCQIFLASILNFDSSTQILYGVTKLYLIAYG